MTIRVVPPHAEEMSFSRVENKQLRNRVMGMEASLRYDYFIFFKNKSNIISNENRKQE